MAHTCTHDRCIFFIDEGAERCPGCGRSLRSGPTTWLIANSQVVALAAIALLGLFLALWLVQGWWLAGFMVAAIAGVVGKGAQQNQGATSRFTSLDSRYEHAVGESERWLGKWTELFALNAGRENMPEDERLLMVEAQAAAADAAADASSRRNEYANRYFDNGFERLQHLSESEPRDPCVDWQIEWRQAVARIEYYLDTLWIDQHVANRARIRLQEFQLEGGAVQQRTELIRLADTVRLFDPSPPFSNTVVGTGVAIDLTDEADAQRHRLRAERRLLRDAPLCTADFSSDDESSAN